MNKMALLIVLAFGVQLYADTAQEKTEALHAEAKAHKAPNLTQESHPTLYAMVKNLTTKAHTDMPKYITVHGAEHSIVTQNGTIYKGAQNITAWTDALGDLHICYEILTDLSYEEVEGILAVAIAEKAKNKPVKLLGVGFGTFAATAASVYFLTKLYNLSVSSFLFGEPCGYDRQDRLEAFIWLMIAPALLTTKIASNNLQKTIDLEATQLTNPQQVINGIKSLTKLEETYIKENVFSRIASALKLKTMYNTLFYPVREFTPEERVEYLELLTAAA